MKWVWIFVALTAVSAVAGSFLPRVLNRPYCQVEEAVMAVMLPLLVFLVWRVRTSS